MLPTLEERTASETERTETHRRLATEAASCSIKRRLVRALSKIRDAQKACAELGKPYEGPGISTTKQAAKGWLRAAIWRHLRKPERQQAWKAIFRTASTSRPSCSSHQGSRVSDKDYRRAANEDNHWRPPLSPTLLCKKKASKESKQ